MEGTNCPVKFGESLDAYEKALARRNYEGALVSIEDAIAHNPYPSLYEHLTGRRDMVVAAKSSADYVKNRKWWQPRRLTAN